MNTNANDALFLAAVTGDLAELSTLLDGGAQGASPCSFEFGRDMGMVVLKLGQLEVPEGNPFDKDCLERRPVAEFLTPIVEQASKPFVLALTAPWGNGRSGQPCR